MRYVTKQGGTRSLSFATKVEVMGNGNRQQYITEGNSYDRQVEHFIGTVEQGRYQTNRMDNE